MDQGADPTPIAPGHTSERDRRTVFVLQGGGALGWYQAGVFEGLAEAGLTPDWVAGVSIGAINASLIAGNKPGQQVAALREFWSRITAPSALWPRLPGAPFQAVERRLGATSALLFGQPGFFRPRAPLEWLTEGPPVSFYDTEALRTTLTDLVDFRRINAGLTRLSVGAVEIESGNLVYFDSTTTRLGPAHVMASGALPPALAAVAVDGISYWDGGLVSNTPLQYVTAERPQRDSLIFQVDLFPARGKLPLNFDEVAEREKDIRYSSRTRSGTEAVRDRQNERQMLARFLDRLPEGLRDDPAVAGLRAFACPARIDVVHLIYTPAVPQGAEKDFQFDRPTMLQRWQAGLHDARRALDAAPWTAPAPADAGMRTFDLRPRSQKRGLA